MKYLVAIVLKSKICPYQGNETPCKKVFDRELCSGHTNMKIVLVTLELASNFADIEFLLIQWCAFEIRRQIFSQTFWQF